MSARTVFMIYAAGKRTHAKLVKCAAKPKYGHCKCYKCQRSENMTFIAEATQYGFFEDMHWEVYNCAECQVNTAFQYLVKQPLARVVDRMK
jgi:hypothetical protein